MKKKELKVVDLFAGVGGLSLGFEMLGAKTVLANEYDADIAKSYQKNRPNVKMLVKDITKLDLKETFEPYKSKVDVVVGGPPCQGFSQKGQRKSINDERNFLFRYYVDVVKLLQPKYFVMENVPNLLTTENGFFKDEITSLFNQLGYTINPMVLNAADYGVPQNRHRAVIIGKKGSEKVEMIKPLKKQTTAWDVISDLAFLESGEGNFEQDYLKAAETDYQKQMRKKSSRLFNHCVTAHSIDAIKKLKLIPPEKGKEFLPKKMLTKSIYSGTWSRIEKDKVSVTITTRFDTPSSGRFSHPFLNRAITVREAARLQSFPDDFVFYGNKSSQMKQVGNAVPPLLAKAIAQAICNDMEKKS